MKLSRETVENLRHNIGLSERNPATWPRVAFTDAETIAAVLDAAVAYAEAHAALYTCSDDQEEVDAVVAAVERTGTELLALIEVREASE